MRSASEMSDYVGRSGGADRLLHFGSKVTPRIKFRVSFDDGITDFNVRMRHGVDDQLFSQLSISESELPSDFVRNLELRPGVALILSFFGAGVGCWRHYHFHDTGTTSPMKQTADVHDNRQLRGERLESRGVSVFAAQKTPRSLHSDSTDRAAGRAIFRRLCPPNRWR